MVKVNSNLRVNFAYLIQKDARGGTVPLTVVRAGKKMLIEMPVPTHRPLLVEGLQGQYPSYFIYGPLVFERATLETFSLLRSSPGSVAGSSMIAHLGDPPTPEHQELVLISSPLFPHALSKGYSNSQRAGPGLRERRAGDQPRAAGGLPARPEGRVRRPRLRSAAGSEGLVFPRAQLVAATGEILTDNGVREEASADMLKVWQERK